MWRSRLVSPKKKTNALLVLLLTMALTSGCGSETEESRAELQKDGSVKSVISESFDKPDYDINELQQMVLDDVACGADTVVIASTTSHAEVRRAAAWCSKKFMCRQR